MPSKKKPVRTKKPGRADLRDLPSLDVPTKDKAKADPELEKRVRSLVTAVARDDGREYPPEWAPIADAAKRRGYLLERAFRLHLTEHGKQWLRLSDEPVGSYTMIKVRPPDRVTLKDLSHDTGVLMQDAIGHVLDAIYDNRDALTRIAVKHGAKYPWEAIPFLIRNAK